MNTKLRDGVIEITSTITNPTGNKLYNKEGLPASPFRTDDGEK